jgi:hypothetical protein
VFFAPDARVRGRSAAGALSSQSIGAGFDTLDETRASSVSTGSRDEREPNVSIKPISRGKIVPGQPRAFGARFRR